MKRPGDTDTVALIPETKKARADVALYSNKDKQLLEAVIKVTYYRRHPFTFILFLQGIRRTSNLLSPIMALDGHQGEIFTCAFDPEGDYLVSSGFDRQICECEAFPYALRRALQCRSLSLQFSLQTFGRHTANARMWVRWLATQAP